MSESSTTRLIRAAAGGDRAALETLLTGELPALRAFVRCQADPALRARESSSDLVQSVCREVLAKADQFRFAEPEGFRRWLFTSAMRKVRDRRDHHLAAKRDARREVDADALAGAYASLTSPSGAAARQEQLERVERAMDTLPDEYRQVIALSKVAGLTRPQVAAEMGRSEGSVRMLLHRALARLVAELEGEA
jgi:RNA polymerase sigma-70 factor (ECF subfamily)